MRKLTVLLLVVILSGCATTWKKTEPKEYINDSLKFAAYLPIDWMYLSQGKSFDITKDGELLNEIFVETVEFNKELSATKKQYKSSMLVDELSEVDIDNLRSNAQFHRFEVFNNQIVAFSGKDAYRFEFKYQTPEGLKKKGIVYGVSHRERLYRIAYLAAEQHYYDLGVKPFESFIQSFRFLESNEKKEFK